MRKKTERGLHELPSQPTKDEVIRWIDRTVIGNPVDEAAKDMRLIAERYADQMAEAFIKISRRA